MVLPSTPCRCARRRRAGPRDQRRRPPRDDQKELKKVLTVGHHLLSVAGIRPCTPPPGALLEAVRGVRVHVLDKAQSVVTDPEQLNQMARRPMFKEMMQGR